MTQRRRAVIVGAGIGGPVLALWLQKIGWDVALTEARSSLSAEGAFLGLAPNGLAALEPLGIAGRVAARGHACDAFEFTNRSGRVLGAIDRRDDRAAFGNALTMVRRADLHDELAAVCAERGLPIRFGLRLVGLDAHADRAVARFADGSCLEADVVIGCDGVRSTTRRLALPDAPEPTATGLLDLGGFARVDGLPFAPGVNAMVFGARAFFGAFRTPDGETWWFHNGPPDDDDVPAEARRARLLDLHRDDPAWVREVIAATPALLGPWRIHELTAMSRWGAGRACLIGDAAHAMSPSAGQGASLAMEDALVLSQCLRDVADTGAAFALFERLRRPRVDAIFRAARRNSNNKALSAVGAWFRDRMLPLFLPAAGRAQSAAYAFRLDWALPVASREARR